MRWVLPLVVAMELALSVRCESTEPNAELVFPMNPKHNHSPCIVECANGDLMVCWYRGSGERRADDVVILGARKHKGDSKWSEPFLMADTPDLPDCNPVMMIDDRGELHLFYPAILDNEWESAVLMHRRSTDYLKDGPPKWSWQQPIFLKPEGIKEQIDQAVDAFPKAMLEANPRFKAYGETLKNRAKQKIYQRLGWMPRIRPLQLANGDILVPLYCDTFSIGILAISSDHGDHWKASQAIVGIGAIQPALVQRNDGTLFAYMRENGPHHKIRVASSKDLGRHWGPVTETDIVNPGSSVDVIRLKSGNWVLIYNNLAKGERGGRHKLAVSMSDDEGKSWKWTRHVEWLEPQKSAASYPSLLQTTDGMIHATYRYNESKKEGSTIKHSWFDEEWIKAGDPPRAQ